MKKKFAAAFVAFALTMAMPAAAFAAVSEGSIEASKVPAQKDTVAIDTTAEGNGMTAVTVKGDTANVYANNFGTDKADSQANAADFTDTKAEAEKADIIKAYDKAVADINEKLANPLLKPAEKTALEQQLAAMAVQHQANLNAADTKWANKELAYNNKVEEFAGIPGNGVINTFQLNGDSAGSLTVTIVLDESYEGHVVTAIYMDEDGNIKTSTQRVIEGCIVIEKNGFCVWTLVDCSGGLPKGTVIENGVDASDFEKALNVFGNATDKGTSPKTGC